MIVSFLNQTMTSAIASRVRRSNVFTLLTYFRVPEHMNAFEKLSVSSLTAVRTGSLLRFVGPAHVAQPWQFPRYYTHEWLQSVRREHVQAFVGVHDEASGALVRKWPLNWIAHDSLDLIVAALQSDDDVATLQSEFVDDVAINALDHNDEEDVDADTELTAHGFILTDDDVAMKRLAVPASHWLRGAAEFGASRRFVHTAVPLEQGMCGGVVSCNDKRRRFVGLIEGRVQAGPAHLIGTASLIERAAVAEFVRSEAAQKLGAVL